MIHASTLSFALRCAISIALAATLAACGGGGGGAGGIAFPFPPPGPVTPPPSEGSATIGPEGGVVQGPDGVQVTVPAGALEAPVTLRIARDDSGAPGLPADAQRLSPVYAFTPHGQQFALPVEIRLPIDFAALPAGKSPPILMSQPGEQWVSLPADEVAQDGGAVRFLSDHFSYAVGVCNQACAESDPWFGGALLGSYPLEPAQAQPGQPQRKLIEQAGPRTVRISALPRAFQPGTNRHWCGGPATLRLMRANLWPQAATHLATQVFNGPGAVDVRVDIDHTLNGPRGFYVEWSCARASGWPPNTAFTGGILPPTEGLAAVLVRIPVPVDAPTITRQPADAAADAGQNASFGVEALAPDSLFVQWQRSDDGGATWRNVGTGGTYVLAGVQAADHGALFRAQVCNVRGLVLNCIVSDTVRLDYTGPLAPAITQVPQSVSVAAGQTASFSVAASGRPAPAFTWFRKDAAGDTEVGSGATYTTPATQAADDGARFYAVARNSAGQAASAEALLTVTASAQAPAVGAVTAAPGLSIAACSSVTLSASATGTAPLSYQWRRNGGALADGQQPDTCNGSPATVSGAGSATLVLGNVPAAWSGSGFDLAVSNGAGQASSGSVTLTVTAPTATGWSPGATVNASPGTPLPAGPWNYGDASVQIYGSGDAWAMLSGSTAAYDTQLWAARYRAAAGPAGAWDTPELLVETPNGPITAPVGIASDDAGRSVAVWVERSPSSAVLRLRHHDGSAWGPAQALDSGTIQMGLFPWQQVRVVRAGAHALIVWARTENGSGASSVRARRLRLADGVLEAPEILGTSSASQADAAYRMPLQLAATPQGDAMAFWQHLDSTVRASRYTASSGQWTLDAADGPTATDYSTFTLDGTGRAWQAVPQDDGSGAYTLTVHTLTPGASNWEIGSTVTGAFLTGPMTPRLLADAAGNAMLAWACTSCPQADPGMNNAPIHASRFDAATQAWSTPEQLDTRPAGSNGFTDMHGFDLRMNPLGDAVAVWSYTGTVLGDGTGVELKTFARHYQRAANAWGAATPLAAPAAGEDSAPLVALAAGSPRALALWTHSPGRPLIQPAWSVYQP